MSTTAGTEDPAIAAITEWRDAWDFAWKDAANLTAEEEDSEARQQILDAECQAQLRAAETRATTIAELPAQLLFAFIVFGDKTYASDPDDPMNYLFPDWTDELDGTTAQHARDGPRTFGSGGTGMIGDLYLGAVLAVRRRITCDVNCAFDPVWTANLPGCVPAHAETAPDYDPAGPSGPAFMPYANGLSQGALRQGSISPRPHRSMDALDARRADADLVQSLGTVVAPRSLRDRHDVAGSSRTHSGVEHPLTAAVGYAVR